MSDGRTRELERRFRESGAVADEAAWLSARLRAGEVGFDAVALDAYLGHPAAQLALGEPVEPVTFADEDGLTIWMRGFKAWGRETLARALLARLRIAAGPPRSWAPAFHRAQGAVDEWCRAPSIASSPRPSRALEEAVDDARVTRDIAIEMRVVLDLVQRQPEPDQGDDLLARLDWERRLSFQHRSPVPKAICAVLRGWGTGGVRLGAAIGGQPRVRHRIELAMTSTPRRRIVSLLRAFTRQWCRIVTVSSEDRVVFVSGTGFESMRYEAPPVGSMPLQTIRDVLPSQPAEGCPTTL